MGRNSKISKIYMHNGKWQQAAHTTSQLSSPSSSTRAMQKKAHLTKNMLYTPLTNYNCTSRGIQKSPSLEEKYWIIFWRKKCQENVPLAEK